MYVIVTRNVYIQTRKYTVVRNVFTFNSLGVLGSEKSERVSRQPGVEKKE
jgi:hypothetical protein